jgi:hypothetical protein
VNVINQSIDFIHRPIWILDKFRIESLNFISKGGANRGLRAKPPYLIFIFTKKSKTRKE